MLASVGVGLGRLGYFFDRHIKKVDLTKAKDRSLLAYKRTLL
ncbi:unnamed protein product, partial [Brassica oleracea]